MTLKNVYFYWVIIALPLLALAIAGLYFHLTADWFALLLIAYAFIYRPWTDGTRLYICGKITSKQLWRFFVPFWITFRRSDYFSFLYFDK